MALSIKLVSYFSVVDAYGVEHRMGSTAPVSISATGDVIWYNTQSVASAATATLYDDTESGHPADFDFLCIISSVADVVLELTTDQNGSVGDELYTIELAANVPFILASDVSYANYSAAFAGGTLDTIERIRVKNNNASAAVIRTFIAT